METISTEIINFDTEQELLLYFTHFIQSNDPDIIYGYNSDCFDFNYLMIRAEVTKCMDRFCKLSKLYNYDCKVTEAAFSSSAYGDNKYLRVEIPGRLVVDLMIWIQRNMPVDRYPSYSLNNVAKTVFLFDILIFQGN